MPTKAKRTIRKPPNLASVPASQRVDAVTAAKYIGVSKSTIDKMALTGNGPVFLKIGSRRIYDTADLDKFLASKRRVSTSDRGQQIAA